MPKRNSESETLLHNYLRKLHKKQENYSHACVTYIFETFVICFREEICHHRQSFRNASLIHGLNDMNPGTGTGAVHIFCRAGAGPA